VAAAPVWARLLASVSLLDIALRCVFFVHLIGIGSSQFLVIVLLLASVTRTRCAAGRPASLQQRRLCGCLVSVKLLACALLVPHFSSTSIGIGFSSPSRCSSTPGSYGCPFALVFVPLPGLASGMVVNPLPAAACRSTSSCLRRCLTSTGWLARMVSAFLKTGAGGPPR